MSELARAPFDQLPSALVAELDDARVDARAVYDSVARAIAEDVPGGVDVTSAATIPRSQVEVADFVVRADGVVAGICVAELVFRYVGGAAVEVVRPVSDGTHVKRGDVVLTVTGPTSLLLTAERTALNFCCHLSGVATATSQWVAALQGTGAKVRDTRKTIPGFRLLEKYAVRCGGGTNHRTSLSDQALVKDNHVIAAGGVVAAYEAVRRDYPDLPVQVEVDSLQQLTEILAAGATQVLLDNMDVRTMTEAVRIRDAHVGARATLEASGGLTLDHARAVAETGVDYLAVGALTHSAQVFDIGMDLRPLAPGAVVEP